MGKIDLVHIGYVHNQNVGKANNVLIFGIA